MRALVLADGTSSSRAALDDAWPGWDAGVELVIAADGGARIADALGLAIDAWIGDGDSLAPADRRMLAAAGVPMLLVPEDKDASDTELGVREATGRGATDITILGALGGGRHDHSLANVTLLANPALAGRGARLLDATARVHLLLAGVGPDVTRAGGAGGATWLELEGREDDVVTLLPFGGDVLGVTVAGLAYPLTDERLDAGSTRGLSNLRTAAVARIEIVSGRLLVVETPATLIS